MDLIWYNSTLQRHNNPSVPFNYMFYCSFVWHWPWAQNQTNQQTNKQTSKQTKPRTQNNPQNGPVFLPASFPYTSLPFFLLCPQKVNPYMKCQEAEIFTKYSDPIVAYMAMAPTKNRPTLDPTFHGKTAGKFVHPTAWFGFTGIHWYFLCSTRVFFFGCWVLWKLWFSPWRILKKDFLQWTIYLTAFWEG